MVRDSQELQSKPSTPLQSIKSEMVPHFLIIYGQEFRGPWSYMHDDWKRNSPEDQQLEHPEQL